jgi:hypothetical protein
MKEEIVTITILNWLKSNGWQIVSFDFPQSGTGISLHPNIEIREKTKNKGTIIFDIISNKENASLFFENKDHFALSDFNKLHYIKSSNDYSNSIKDVLQKFPTKNCYFGIGLPNSNHLEDKLSCYLHLIDFLFFINEDMEIMIIKGKEIFE